MEILTNKFKYNIETKEQDFGIFPEAYNFKI